MSYWDFCSCDISTSLFWDSCLCRNSAHCSLRFCVLIRNVH